MLQDLFGILMVVSIICLIVGLAKPSIFSRVFKKEMPRKKIGLIFGVAFVVCFFMVGATAPRPTPQLKVEQKLAVSEQTQEIKTVSETTPTPAVKTGDATTQKTTATPTPAPKTTTTTTPTPAPKNTTPPIATPQYTYYSVSSVVDGDTIKININGTQTTLRLIGIDTPETVDPRKPVQCFGKEASNKAKELLSGKKVRIEKDATQGELDKYGRLLAYIYREDGLFYNKYIIEQGYAHEYTYNTPYKYQSEFKTAEKYARENQLGLWSPNTCNGDTTSSASTPTPTQTDTQTNTGKYYTSSYYSSKYYYPEACSAWQGLSPSYLKSFDSLESLLSAYPSRALSPQCQ